ncbi:MAG: helix-hairpin-helix domain-containing protein [Georgenia sp.]
MSTRRTVRNARLRALTRAAYTATAGHLEIDPEEESGRAPRRWSVSARAAIGAAVIVLLVGVALALRAWAGAPAVPTPLPPPGELEPSVGASAPSGEPAGPADEPSTAPDGPADPSGAMPPDATPSGPTTGGGPSATTVVVHVAGAVRHPGLVELRAGARVADAVEAAGGATDDAEVAAVNLARLLVDAEQVYLPRVGESPLGGAGAAGAAPGGGTGGEAAGGAAGADGPVDLNTAGRVELDALPGVGPVLAERILAWRDLNGPFTSVEDLDAVSGIGPAMMERLRDLVTT